MPKEPSLTSAMINDRTLNNLPRAEKPTIKVLLYTDAPDVVVREPVGQFGLGRMIDHLESHKPAFANLRIKWESRYPNNSTTADNRIHVALQNEISRTGQPFDQIWFFGIHQVNKRKPNLRLCGGTPESELNADEVKALEEWMDRGGGVLMTGDHSHPRPMDALPPDPNSPCPDNSVQQGFLGLGRALGRCVPRAGELRDWEGEPTADPLDSYNTHVNNLGTDFEDSGLQRDPIPQELCLQLFDEKGKPAPVGQSHPLFFYRAGREIKFFPDHAHEGALVIPKVLREPLWRKNAAGFQPEPRVVAYGFDKRNGDKLKLVSAYDGATAGVGRIVADSSWHHYFNINLENFLHTATESDAADQIGQFYANLAVWLSPTEKRWLMADTMIRWLAQQPVVLEEFGPVPTEHLGALIRTGAAARALLARVASPCEIHELLQMTFSEERCRQFETLYLPEKSLTLSPIPSKELVLGYLVNRYPQEAIEVSKSSLTDESRLTAVGEAFVGASEQAFRRQRREITRTLKSAERLFSPVYLKTTKLAEREKPVSSSVAASNIQLVEGSIAMTACLVDEWDIELRLDRNPSTSETIGFRKVAFTNGVLSGEVHDEPEQLMSALRGTCLPIPVVGQPDMSLMNFIFTVKDNRGVIVLLHLTGVAYQPPGGERPRPHEFRGQFRAYPVFSDDTFSPSAVAATLTGQLENLAIDPGDTGTGNGQQT